MSISFEEIGQVLVTCLAEEGVTEGHTVKVSQNNTVAPCEAGDAFCGVALSVAEDGYAAVQMKGFVTVDCADETVAAGACALAADGAGGVKADGNGMTVTVMAVEDGKAVLCL